MVEYRVYIHLPRQATTKQFLVDTNEGDIAMSSIKKGTALGAAMGARSGPLGLAMGMAAGAAAGASTYIVEGAEVFCTQGTCTTNMVASCKCKTGNELAIVDTDTKPGESFEGYFGNCKANNLEPCELHKDLLPEWFEVKEDYKIDGGEEPHVTMESFAICIAGPGIIIPLEDGQSKEDFKEHKEKLNGLLEYILYGNDPVNMATGNFVYSKNDIEKTIPFCERHQQGMKRGSQSRQI